MDVPRREWKISCDRATFEKCRNDEKFAHIVALAYEIIKLIRRMNKTFHNDEIFQKELRHFLKDPSAKKIEEAHLKPVRRKAVFHFDPDGFAETILKSTLPTCTSES